METLQVLVCDDETALRMGVRRALQRYSVEAPELGGVVFEIREAESGEECLALIEAQPPDILLLDHKLPGISGLDVLDRVHDQPGDMLTIMITAHASIEAAVRATKQGAYDFLPKPFTPAELREAVRKAARHFILERQARRLAEEKRRVRFEFISVLAHELKAPINAVDGYLKILQSGIGADNAALRTEIVDRCSTRIGGMRKLIDDLLDLTRIESGQKPRELAPVKLDDVARRACETAMPGAEARGITVTLQADEPILHTADASELEIIFNNLISNAVKYNRDGGKVLVSLSKQDDAVRIAVCDTGIGMTTEEAARLFQDFVRIRNEKTQDILGSGLGLSIVRKLALLYNGDIAVDSVPDVGSTFTVTLR